MDERREYLLFYVHILSSKINNDRLFRFAGEATRPARLAGPALVDVSLRLSFSKS
jgi:hypothetical protein